MKFIYLSATFFSALVAQSAQLECVAGALPSLKDCIFLLSVLEQVSGLWNPLQWGRSLEDEKPNYVHLPKGYGLNPIPPGSQRSNTCEFFVDNRPGAEDLTDTFPKASIVEAVTDILAHCYPQGKTGIAFPTILGNVFVTVRPRYSVYTASNQTRLALPGHEGENITVTDYDPASLNHTSKPQYIGQDRDQDRAQVT